MRYYVNSGLFFSCILLFLLPFMEIRCNGSALGHMTGYDLATKGELRMKDPEMMEYMKGAEYESIRKQQTGPDPFTILSVALLFTGGVLQLLLKRKREIAAILTGSAVVVILATMQIIYKVQWNEKMSEGVEFMTYVKFTIHFVAGYWLAMAIPALVASLNTWFLVSDKRAYYSKPFVENPEAEDILNNPTTP